MSGRIEVHILTGFLGSGKTTLLNHALATVFGSETAVVVSEFGQVALDDVLISARSEETLTLKSGCVCCVVRSDLVTTLMEIAARADACGQTLTRVVIETSGVSDPVPMLHTLQSDFNLLTRFACAGIVCTVDATMPPHDRARREALMQVASADRFVITKHDLAGEAGVANARDWVAATNPLATCVAAGAGDLAQAFSPLEQAGAGLDARLAALGLASEPGRHAVEARVLRVSGQPSWPAFAVWLSALLHWHGDRLLRIKGMLWDEERQSWIGVQTVRGFIHPPEHLPQTARLAGLGACLVLIGEALDFASIERSFQQWVLQV